MNIFRRTAIAATFSALCVSGVASHGIAQAATITTLHTFGSWHDSPTTGLVYGPGGALYGATTSEIYQLAQDAGGRWHYQTIYAGGAVSIAGSASALYIAVGDSFTPAILVELLPPIKGGSAWKATVLHIFNGGKNGLTPSGITLAPDGSLYGTTDAGGGVTTDCPLTYPPGPGCGMVFRLAAVNGRWGERLLYAFRGAADGSYPVAAPSLDAAGDVFLTTSQGNQAVTSDLQCGRLVELRAPALTLEDYNLCDYLGQAPYYPQSVVYPIQSAAAPGSHLIVTTYGGGPKTHVCGAYCGVIAEFERTASETKPWNVKTIHDFTGPDGYEPTGYLTPDGPTRLYGVAKSNVGTCAEGECGEIFTLVYGATGWAWGGVVYRFTKDVGPVTQLTFYKGKLLGTTEGDVYPGIVYDVMP